MATLSTYCSALATCLPLVLVINNLADANTAVCRHRQLLKVILVITEVFVIPDLFLLFKNMSLLKPGQGRQPRRTEEQRRNDRLPAT